MTKFKFILIQGALAVEIMEGDDSTAKVLKSLNHRDTALRVVAERSFMKTLMGGCSAPVAVQTKINQESLSLKGGVFRKKVFCSCHNSGF